MELFNRWLKSKTVRRFDQAVKKHDYPQALEIARTGRIPAYRLDGAKHRQIVFQAVGDAAPSAELTQTLIGTANGIQDDAVLDRLDGPERTSAYLAKITIALTNGNLDAVPELISHITTKDGRPQALSKTAAHMACTGQSDADILKVISAMPTVTHAEEELRNLFLSKIISKEFDAARALLPEIRHQTRRGLEPQLTFIERHHGDLDQARLHGRDLGHPDDIALTMALVAGTNGDIDMMAQYTRDVSAPIRTGAVATYATSLAYAGKTAAAIELLGAIREDPHAYLLRLGYIAFLFPFSEDHMADLYREFSKAVPYEGALAFWYHQFIAFLANQQPDAIGPMAAAITNSDLRRSVAGLLTDFVGKMHVAQRPVA